MNIWKVYHDQIPEYLVDFMNEEKMLRLQKVGMDCGCEYTAFSTWKNIPPYSRYDHSVGVALIVHHFTGERKQALAGLFHDISTPVFAHVVDFVNGDYQKQQSTEDDTSALIRSSAGLQRLLTREKLVTSQVDDYHLYPIADNDSPQLSADRLEYSLGNFHRYLSWSLEDLSEVYSDLTVTENEKGICELAFRSEEKAVRFTEAALIMGRLYSSEADRYRMEVLARILKEALRKGIITKGDLMTTEPEVIAAMHQDEEIWQSWLAFRRMKDIHISNHPLNDNWLKIVPKKRYIDPLIVDKGRVSTVSQQVNRKIEEFLNESFDCYLFGD